MKSAVAIQDVDLALMKASDALIEFEISPFQTQ
jgi:hypothetical protein